ncbi:type II toxin-antitoxin system VapC family toxin [Salmonirosea aquatica]|uniref:PIN domain-containing protein n=1 Tax=Salmonirosea aquatica TaxID=2654236 RepID=A0A7C9FYY2_9BACT|nr:PIN domain-containing protein [Cytophagaceae bacterium SJW1-29]
MRYLVDTQALIWFADDNSRLSSRAKDLIKNPDNEIFVSQFSYVEIAIKIAVRKISLEKGLISLIENSQIQRIMTLAIEHSHILAYSEIPLLEDHKDPFDRMILATALVEGLPIITFDEKFSWYPDLIKVEW